jgi:hypothetical protein
MSWVEIGIGRKALRHYLLKESIDFKEDKGWFISRFYFKPNERQETEIKDWIKRLQNN